MGRVPSQPGLISRVVSGVQHGNLVLDADGLFTYTPAAGYVGTDSFTYQNANGSLLGNVATVTLNVGQNCPRPRMRT